MQAIKRGFVKLQDGARPEFEWTLRILDRPADELQRKIELPQSVFGFAACNFIRIA